MQKHSYYLARSWARQGVHVDLYYALYPEEKENGDLGEHVTPLEKDNLRFIYVERPRTLYFPGHYLWNSYRTSAALYEEVLASGLTPDFIYAQGFTGWKALLEKQNGSALPPIGVNFHGLNMYQKSASIQSYPEKLMFRPFVRWNLHHADYALSLGGGLDDIIRSIDPEASIIESPNGVSSDWLVNGVLKESGGERTFVFIGRYARGKGIEELHEVLFNFQTTSEWRFEFVGPIPDEVQLDRENVHYWGLIRDESKMRDILSKADILVCPSYSEGLPTVILEGMASGLAVIATEVGAVDALVSEENGWLIPPGDDTALRGAMQRAISISKSRLVAKKKRSREHVQKYFWQNVAAETAENIREALATAEDGV